MFVRAKYAAHMPIQSSLDDCKVYSIYLLCRPLQALKQARRRYTLRLLVRFFLSRAADSTSISSFIGASHQGRVGHAPAASIRRR